MRISDWSSDVCSSDLVPGPRRFRTRSIDDEDDHVGGQQAAQRVEQILLGNKDARATVIEDIGDLGRREMPVYRHGISADMLGAEHRLDKRSEEHTSELQSLMRISYAVFCLKTKQENRHQYTALFQHDRKED